MIKLIALQIAAHYVMIQQHPTSLLPPPIYRSFLCEAKLFPIQTFYIQVTMCVIKRRLYVCLSVTDRIIATVITLVTRNVGAMIFYTKNFNALWRVILRENAVML